jgi:NAD(P)-dependent dehydrogenase (short-subunit alcohol dehydrogenase family)
MSATAQIDAVRRNVLVTGASTGIGRKITERLAATGHRVYAGARKKEDLLALERVENVTALRLDVTQADDIAAAVDMVAGCAEGLYGLVNNAGVATFGAVCKGDEQELTLTLAVNALAPYLVTQAFVPLLRAAQGRIVMIGSISGILAEANLAAYSMSKHALEALTDALAAELAPTGVHVSIVEPGGFRTELVSNAQERLPRAGQLPDLTSRHEPDVVANAVSLALFERRPKRRYLVATGDETRATIGKQIEQLVQLNEDHPHSYSRDALVAMLDAALSRSAPR